jgi:hypothetical protein
VGVAKNFATFFSNKMKVFFIAAMAKMEEYVFG